MPTIRIFFFVVLIVPRISGKWQPRTKNKWNFFSPTPRAKWKAPSVRKTASRKKKKLITRLFFSLGLNWSAKQEQMIRSCVCARARDGDGTVCDAHHRKPYSYQLLQVASFLRNIFSPPNFMFITCNFHRTKFRMLKSFRCHYTCHIAHVLMYISCNYFEYLFRSFSIFNSASYNINILLQDKLRTRARLLWDENGAAHKKIPEYIFHLSLLFRFFFCYFFFCKTDDDGYKIS